MTDFQIVLIWNSRLDNIKHFKIIEMLKNKYIQNTVQIWNSQLDSIKHFKIIELLQNKYTQNMNSSMDHAMLQMALK